MEFKRILVNPTHQVERDPAVELARQMGQQYGATITLFDVAPDLSWPMQLFAGGSEQLIEDISGRKRKLMSAIVHSLEGCGTEVTSVLGEGRLSAATVRQVLKDDVDLVVKVAEEPTSNRSGFLGSTDFRLLRKCPCPVLILKREQENTFETVAVALDVLDDHTIQRSLDEKVLAAAQSISTAAPALIYSLPPIEDVIEIGAGDRDLITVEQLKAWDEQLAEAANKRMTELRLGNCPSESVQHLLRGDPEEAIPEYVQSHGTDLLVLGTIARSGLYGLFMGNTAERILGKVDCAILALKPTGFVSPLEHSSSADISSR